MRGFFTSSTLTVALAAFASGCGQQPGITPLEEPCERLILLEIDGLGAVPCLPGAYENSGPMHVACTRLAEDLSMPVPELSFELAESAVRADRLVMMVDSRIPESFDGRENISIRTVAGPAGGSAVPVAEPADLLTGMDVSGWGSLSGRQRIVQDLADRFGPDIIIVGCSTADADTAIAIGTEWLVYISSSGGNLVIFSPPDARWYRGWSVMAGEGFDPVPPIGITPAGLLNTATILAGLGPAVPLSSGVPALGTLHQGGKIIP